MPRLILQILNVQGYLFERTCLTNNFCNTKILGAYRARTRDGSMNPPLASRTDNAMRSQIARHN